MNEKQVKALDELNEALKQLEDDLPDEIEDLDDLSRQKRTSAKKRIEKIVENLEKIKTKVDPNVHPEYVLDPSDPNSMGRLIAEALLAQERIGLTEVPRFWGSGVYAMYYRGDFSVYSPISGSDTPLYVGKVDPKDPSAQTPEEQGEKLWYRLIRDHAKSIRAAENLNIEDFDCRYLVVKSAWQNTAETYLIARFKPIWNREMGVCYGIGKHGDDPSTRTNVRSPWDELHPGREWAKASEPYPGGQEAVKEAIRDHFENNPPQE